MIKRVSLWEDPGAKAPTLLATFRLDDDGSVHAEFQFGGFEQEIRDGIFTPVGWATERVFLEDGRLFFDALDSAFAGSSLTVVTREP
jgi:hypothetical protein